MNGLEALLHGPSAATGPGILAGHLPRGAVATLWQAKPHQRVSRGVLFGRLDMTGARPRENILKQTFQSLLHVIVWFLETMQQHRLLKSYSEHCQKILPSLFTYSLVLVSSCSRIGPSKTPKANGTRRSAPGDLGRSGSQLECGQPQLAGFQLTREPFPLENKSFIFCPFWVWRG